MVLHCAHDGDVRTPSECLKAFLGAPRCCMLRLRQILVTDVTAIGSSTAVLPAVVLQEVGITDHALLLYGPARAICHAASQRRPPKQRLAEVCHARERRPWAAWATVHRLERLRG